MHAGSSSLSSDSLHDAFASLDAASVENRELNDGTSLPSDESAAAGPSSRPIYAVERQQWLGHGPRALCGGPTLEEMRREALQSTERARERKEKLGSSPHLTSFAAPQAAMGPSFDAFPLSIPEETQKLDQVDGSVVEHPHSASPAPPSPAADGINSQRPKRTLQWAAKRNRRITRRRECPPLTRRQAQLQGCGLTQETNAVPDMTVDVTDPSFGSEAGEVEVERPRRETATGKRRKKQPPMLELTFTEQVQEGSGQEGNRCSPASSQTESDASRDCVTSIAHPAAAALSKGKVRSRESSITSSETEEEMTRDEVAGTSKRLAKQAAPRGRRLPTAARGIAPSKERGDRHAARTRGVAIFRGLTFLLVGFWAKVKMFEGLVEKHGGNVVRAKDLADAELERLHFIVACTHTGHKPKPSEVDRWMVQLAGQGKETADVRSLSRTTPLIDAAWLSDCIAVRAVHDERRRTPTDTSCPHHSAAEVSMQGGSAVGRKVQAARIDEKLILGNSSTFSRRVNDEQGEEQQMYGMHSHVIVPPMRKDAKAWQDGCLSGAECVPLWPGRVDLTLSWPRVSLACESKRSTASTTLDWRYFALEHPAMEDGNARQADRSSP